MKNYSINSKLNRLNCSDKISCCRYPLHESQTQIPNNIKIKNEIISSSYNRNIYEFD